MKKITKGEEKHYILANQVHRDELLGNISVKYKPEGFIAMDVAPSVPVKKTTNEYRIYDRNFRIPETERANRAKSREHMFDVSFATYNLKRHSLHSYVSDTDQDNYDLADLRAETTEELTEKILLRHELEVANLMTTTAWSLNVSFGAGATFSDNTTTTNPIPSFQTGSSTVIANSGMTPNQVVLPRLGFIRCVNHISILDRLKYTSADVDSGKLAALFGVSSVLVPSIARDTAEEGASGGSVIAAIWDEEKAWIGYKPDAPGPLKPSSMYTFRKAMPLVKRWRDEERESEVIEVNMEFQAKVVASLSGYLLSNVT